MVEHAFFSEEEARFLRALHDEDVAFLVVGLAAAALQGAQAVTQDVDLWFRDLSHPGIARALRRVGGVYVAPTGSTPPMFSGRAVSPFDIVVTMHGLGPFDQEAREAVTIMVDDVPLKVLPLRRVIASKKATNRPKDRAILPALEAAMRAAGRKGKQP